MIILISAIILLGIVTYYFHRLDLKKQVEKTNKIVQTKIQELRKKLRTASRLRTRQPARRSKQNNRILRRRRARCLERNRTRQLYTRTNRTLSGNFLYATTGRCAGVGTQFAITTNRRPRCHCETKYCSLSMNKERSTNNCL